MASLDPAHTRVLAVSALDYKSRAFAGFPETGRTDGKLLATFRSLGVGQERIVWLQGKDTETQRLDYEFREMVAKAKKGDVVFVYYTGHGYVQKDQLLLATYNAEVGFPGWRMTRAFKQIRESFRGRAVVFLVDCCASGRLVDYAKSAGGKVAVIASSSAEEEVPEGWDFTTALCQAFSGRAEVDTDGDGQVSLQETSRFVNSQRGSSYFPTGFGLTWKASLERATRFELATFSLGS